MDDQTAVTYYGAPQIIIVRYLVVPVPGDYYPGKCTVSVTEQQNYPLSAKYVITCGLQKSVISVALISWFFQIQIQTTHFLYTFRFVHK